MSSFFQDLSLGAISSPVARAPVSVLSPSFQRFLDRESTPQSPPPPVRITVETGVSAFVTPVDVAVDACVAVADQSVQAVVETGETSTEYDPPVDALPAALSSPVASASGTLEADIERSDVPSTDSTDTLLEAAEDVPAGDPLSAEPAPEGAVPGLVPVSAETSPLGPSLVDSDDEPIASRLPGYLNISNSVKYLIGNFYSFLFISIFTSVFHVFLLFHLFSIVFCFSYDFLQLFSFSITFSSLKVLSIAFFFSDHFFRTFHLFYILKFSRSSFSYFSSVSFQFTSLFHR